MIILLKRAYEEPKKEDGFRILVDRVWPRGVSKDFGQIDLWAKEITPTTTLRKWFSHEIPKWEEFKKKYTEELENRLDAVDGFLETLQKHKKVTFVYGAKDTKHTHAIVLKEYMQEKSES